MTNGRWVYLRVGYILGGYTPHPPPKLRKEKNYESLLKRGKGKKRKEKSIVYSRVFKYRHFFEVWDLRVFKSVRVSVDIPKGTDQWPSNMEHSFDLLLFFWWWCFFFSNRFELPYVGGDGLFIVEIYIYYIYIVDGRNHAPPGMYTTLEMGTTVGGWHLASTSGKVVLWDSRGTMPFMRSKSINPNHLQKPL